MSQFMLLLYDNVDAIEQWEKLSPEEIQRILEKYMAWSEELAGAGRLVGSEKLRDGTGRVLRGAGDVTVMDGPFSEAREIMGGYYIIRASDYDEAVAISRDCPHLEFGGTIEIREVEALG